MTLKELTRNISYRLAGSSCFDPLGCAVKRVVTDPYQADADALMVCVKNAVFDGHDLAPIAYERGCRLFLAERGLPLGQEAAVLVVENTAMLAPFLAAACYGYPATRMAVIGITGTAGKSSVAELAAEILRQSGHSVGTLTTDGVRYGDHFRPLGNVVPDGTEIQRILAEMEAAGVAIAILELSAYMLAQKAHLSIPFAALLLTNIAENGPEAARHGGAEAYRAIKASLFESDASFWVFPANFVGFAKKKARVLRFGEGGDLCARERTPLVTDGGFATSITLCVGDRLKRQITLPVLGDLAIENVLAATALCRTVGVTDAELFKALPTVSPRGRLSCLAVFRGRYIYEDTAYTAEALASALRTLRTVTTGKLTVLLGSVGGRTRSRRASLGKAATDWADLAYFTADNADFESAAEICKEMAVEADPDRYVILPDPAYAIRRAVLEMRPGDTLLLAGKGGEDYQLCGGERCAFSARALVEQALLLL